LEGRQLAASEKASEPILQGSALVRPKWTEVKRYKALLHISVNEAQNFPDMRVAAVIEQYEPTSFQQPTYEVKINEHIFEKVRAINVGAVYSSPLTDELG
jgi:hypothetical protein